MIDDMGYIFLFDYYILGDFFIFVSTCQVNPKYPDFKRKDGNVSIWLDKGSKSVLSRLKELEFDTPPVKPKQTKDSKGSE